MPEIFYADGNVEEQLEIYPPTATEDIGELALSASVVLWDLNCGSGRAERTVF